jgi:hypothetical protein
MTNTMSTKNWFNFIIPALISISITLLLFYVDEGKYNFEGILKPDNIFFLLVYAFFFFGFQFVVQIPLKSLLEDRKFRSVISSVASGLILLMTLFVFYSIVK